MCFRPFWQPSSIYSLFIVIINCLLWINKSLSCSYEMWRNYHSRESSPQLGMKANRHNVLLPWQLLVSRAVKRIGYAPLNKPTGSKQTQTQAETNRQTDTQADCRTGMDIPKRRYQLRVIRWATNQRVAVAHSGGGIVRSPPSLVWPWIFV